MHLVLFGHVWPVAPAESLCKITELMLGSYSFFESHPPDIQREWKSYVDKETGETGWELMGTDGNMLMMLWVWLVWVLFFGL